MYLSVHDVSPVDGYRCRGARRFVGVVPTNKARTENDHDDDNRKWQPADGGGSAAGAVRRPGETEPPADLQQGVPDAARRQRGGGRDPAGAPVGVALLPAV